MKWVWPVSPAKYSSTCDPMRPSSQQPHPTTGVQFTAIFWTGCCFIISGEGRAARGAAAESMVKHPRLQKNTTHFRDERNQD